MILNKFIGIVKKLSNFTDEKTLYLYLLESIKLAPLLSVSKNTSKFERSLWGTTRANVANVI